MCTNFPWAFETPSISGNSLMTPEEKRNSLRRKCGTTSSFIGKDFHRSHLKFFATSYFVLFQHEFKSVFLLEKLATQLIGKVLVLTAIPGNRLVFSQILQWWQPTEAINVSKWDFQKKKTPETDCQRYKINVNNENLFADIYKSAKGDNLILLSSVGRDFFCLVGTIRASCSRQPKYFH